MALDFSSGYHMVVLEWAQAQVAATQSAVEMRATAAKVADGTSLVKRRRMPVAGSVVAMSAFVSTAATAGTCKVEVTIGGTVVATGLLTIDTAGAAYVKFGAESVARFVAGDDLGVKITTSGDWDGTASDLLVTLFVLLENWKP